MTVRTAIKAALTIGFPDLKMDEENNRLDGWHERLEQINMLSGYIALV